MSPKKYQEQYDETKVDSNKKQPDETRPNKVNTILTIIKGSDVDFGKNFIFLKDNITLGRSDDNDVCINDEKVSKQHCAIHIIKNQDIEQIALKDLGSTNGTYVNSHPVQQKVLKIGDKIEVGDTVLKFSYNDEVEEKYHSRLFNFAVTDSLTGLYNKRYLLNELENHSKIAKRNNSPFSIAIFDIDNFKQVNDNYGHLAGDDYLKKIAELIESSLREQDICCRFGGEEFMILLVGTDLEGAYKLADRIREKVESYILQFNETPISTTISAGISQYRLPDMDLKELLKNADQALLKAKNSGKNAVIKSTTP